MALLRPPLPDGRAARQRFLSALAEGAAPPAAAGRAGVGLTTLYTWRRRNAAFREAWKKARALARAERYELPARPRPQRQGAAPDQAVAAATAAPKKTLHVVLRSFTPGRPFRHCVTETWPDGTRTDRQWDEHPTRAELIELGEDPDAWDEARRAREAEAPGATTGGDGEALPPSPEPPDPAR